MVIAQHTAFGHDISYSFAFTTRNGLFRIAVPLFFILNGYFIAPVLSGKLRPWLKRTATLYAVWMLASLPLWFSPKLFSTQSFHIVVENLIFGYYHLWYVIALAGSVILLKLLAKQSDRFLWGATVILFGIGIGFEYLHAFNKIDSPTIHAILNTPWIYRNAILFAFPFVTMGYLIKKQNVELRFARIPAWVLIGIGLALPVIESALRLHYAIKGESVNTFATLFIAAPFVFFGVQKIQIMGLSRNLAQLSSALYFVHPLAIKAVQELFHLRMTSLTVATIAFSSLLAVVLIVLNKRLKVIL